MWRLEQDAGETDQSEDDDSSILEGFKMAAKEIKVYIVALMLICIASSASVLNFFPTVVETLGYGRTETLLLTAPPYVSHQSMKDKITTLTLLPGSLHVHILLHCVELRSHRREVLPLHGAALLCYRGLRPCGIHDSNRAAVHLHHAHGPRILVELASGICLGFQRHSAAGSETCCSIGYGQLCGQLRKYFWKLHVPYISLSQIQYVMGPSKKPFLGCKLIEHDSPRNGCKYRNRFGGNSGGHSFEVYIGS